MLARFDTDRSGTYSQFERLDIVKFLLDASYETVDDFSDASAPLIFSIRWPERDTLQDGHALTTLTEAGFEAPSATRYVVRRRNEAL